VQFGRQVDMVW